MVKRFYILTFIILSFAFSANQSSAQSPSAYIDIQPRQGEVNDQFTFSIAVEGANRVGPPYLTGGDDFKVDFTGSGQKISSSPQGITQIMVFNYILTPKKEGVIDSPGVEIEVDGKTVKIQPIQVKISKSDEIDPKDKENQPVFLNQHLSSNSVYIGQQILHSLELYTRIPVFEINAETESFDGFWSIPHGEPKQGRVLLNGSPIRVTRWTNTLFPLREGEIVIEPRNIKAKIRSRKKTRGLPLGPLDLDDPDIMNDFIGFGTYQEEQFTSEKITLTVKPLPPYPNNFPNWKSSNIVVGKTLIETDYPTEALQVGESRTITVQIRSYGNLSPYNEIPIPQSSDYKIYQEAAKEEKELVGDKIRTTKIYRVSIVPLHPGEISIGQIRFGYFDPESEKYEVAESAPISFNVTGEAINNSSNKDGANQPQLNSEPTAIPTIAPILQTSTIVYEEESFISKLSKSISLSLSLLVLAALFILVIAIYMLRGIALSKYPQKKTILKINRADSISEIRSALLEYLRFKYSLREGELTNSEISAILDKKIEDPTFRFQIESIFDEFDLLIYGKENLSDLNLVASLKNRAILIIKNLK